MTDWIASFRGGDREVAQLLWARYYERLVRYAKARLTNAPRRAQDEEDVALSAFGAFCAGLEAGRFPDICDRNDLWRLLITITTRKAISQIRRESGVTRNPRGKSIASLGDASGLIVGREPTPEFCAQAADDLAYLLNLLADGKLREVAIMKMEGLSVGEIATKLNCSPSTVERKLRMIRHQWSQLLGGDVQE